MAAPFLAAMLLKPWLMGFEGLFAPTLSSFQATLFLGACIAITAFPMLARIVHGRGLSPATRLTGQDNDTALGIGALMNARGLMELITLNIGLQKGIIGVGFLSIMVLMAVVTRLMASPLFEAVFGRKARARGELGAVPG